MRLTVHSDYALRVLTYVAIAPEQIATVTDVANSFRISRHHLVKVANRLSKAGFVETIRGRGGGLRLKRDPTDITIGAVIRATEEDFALVECLGHTRFCRIAGVCQFRELFRRALEAYLSILDEMTLADAVQFPDALRGVLDLHRDAVPSGNHSQGGKIEA